MTELGKQGIQSMGTICVNNAPGFTKICMPDKELSNLGNRSFVEYMCQFDGFVDPGIRIIRWDDNSIFNLAHTFGSGYPTVMTQRWHRDHTRTSHQSEIDMPSAIGQYNKCMGGIDKMDHLIALHPCKFKLRRWPVKVCFHFMDLTLCNAWLLYQLDQDQTHPEKHLDLYHFNRSVSEV